MGRANARANIEIANGSGAMRQYSHAFKLCCIFLDIFCFFSIIDIFRMQINNFEIKEWHFHVYFYQNNERSVNDAYKLRNKLLKAIKEGYFTVVPLERVNHQPIGPHVIGSYETWVPKEYFWQAFSWFTLNRNGLSVLVHPLTPEGKQDHSDRAVWMGTPVVLDLDALQDTNDEIESQYPELNLGYNGA